MKITKFFACALVAFCMSSAFADAANVLVSFSTVADKYADGSPVADGEWYALCWSTDGNFEGLNLDCTPEDPNDLVCIVESLAKDGHCPYTVFQVDSKSPNCKREGVYTVVMLDTRGGTEGKPSKTKPTKVFAAATAKDYTAGSATSGTTPKEHTEGAGAWGYADVGVEVPQPVIKGFQVVDDAEVKIEVENMIPNARYTVKMGKSVDNLDTYSGLQAGSDKATFHVKPGDAKFFQVKCESVSK